MDKMGIHCAASADAGRSSRPPKSRVPKCRPCCDTWQWDATLGTWIGYGSIPINTIFRGMNIHLPAILMWTTGVQGFDTLPIGWKKQHFGYRSNRSGRYDLDMKHWKSKNDRFLSMLFRFDSNHFKSLYIRYQDEYGWINIDESASTHVCTLKVKGPYFGNPFSEDII